MFFRGMFFSHCHTSPLPQHRNRNQCAIMANTDRSPGVLITYVVSLLLCIPIWWVTCRVRRVPLPDLHLEDPAEFTIPVQIVFAGNDLQQGCKLEDLVGDVLRRGKTDNDISYDVSCHSIKHFLPIASTPDETDEKLLGFLTAMKKAEQQPEPHAASALTFFLLEEQAPTRSILDDSLWIMGKHRHGWATVQVDGLQTALEELGRLILTISLPEKNAEYQAVTVQEDVTNFTLSFTLLNSQPDSTWYNWEIEAAIQEHVNPFIHKLQNIFDFSIDSQVCLYPFTGNSFKWSSMLIDVLCDNVLHFSATRGLT